MQDRHRKDARGGDTNEVCAVRLKSNPPSRSRLCRLACVHWHWIVAFRDEEVRGTLAVEVRDITSVTATAHTSAIRCTAKVRRWQFCVIRAPL